MLYISQFSVLVFCIHLAVLIGEMYHLVYKLYNQCVKNSRIYLTTVMTWYTWQLETSVSNTKILLNYNRARICLCSSACVIVRNYATSFSGYACAANNLICYVSGNDSFIPATVLFHLSVLPGNCSSQRMR